MGLIENIIQLPTKSTKKKIKTTVAKRFSLEVIYKINFIKKKINSHDK